MPKLKTVEQFIAMVESNEHDKAIEKFYTIDASIQENQTEPRVGRDNLVANEKNTLLKKNNTTTENSRSVVCQTCTQQPDFASSRSRSASRSCSAGNLCRIAHRASIKIDTHRETLFVTLS